LNDLDARRKPKKLLDKVRDVMRLKRSDPKVFGTRVLSGV